MSEIYNSIMSGIAEAIEDTNGSGRKLKRDVVTVVPVKEYSASEIKKLRKETGMSQTIFAKYIGVSNKTVEAWEAGKNHPSGAASRILNMMEINKNLIYDFPFVVMKQ